MNKKSLAALLLLASMLFLNGQLPVGTVRKPVYTDSNGVVQSTPLSFTGAANGSGFTNLNPSGFPFISATQTLATTFPVAGGGFLISNLNLSFVGASNFNASGATNIQASTALFGLVPLANGGLGTNSAAGGRFVLGVYSTAQSDALTNGFKISAIPQQDGAGTNSTLFGVTIGSNLTVNAAATFTNGITIRNPGSVGLLYLIADTGTAAAEGVFGDNYNANTNTGFGFLGRRARGSFASPTSISNNDTLVFLGGRGYGATGFSPASRGVISIRATENWNDGSNGTRIVFITTANGSSNQTERMYLSDAGSLGIGTNAPAALLHVNGTSQFDGAHVVNGAASFTNGVTIGGTTGTNALLYLIANTGSANAEGIFGDNYNNTANTGFGFLGRRARGTLASPTSVSNDDTLVFISGRGYTGTTFSSPSRATLSLRASENWNDVSNGTKFIFITTANGSTNNTEKMQLTGDGRLGIGTNAPAASLHVNGDFIVSSNFTHSTTRSANAINQALTGSYVTLTNMSQSLVAGNYTVRFSGQLTSSAAAGQGQYGIFTNGVLVPFTDRTDGTLANNETRNISTIDYITILETLTVSIQAKANAGTLAITNKCLITARD